MRMATHALLALMVSVGGAATPASSSPPAESDDGGLTRQAGRFATTLVNPDVDFSRYSKLRPSRVYLRFRDRTGQADGPRTGRIIRDRTRERTVVDSEDLAMYERVIGDAFVSELERCDAFELVDEADRDTLLLRAAVVDIVSKEPSRAERKKGVDVPVLVEGTLVFELVDAETGVIQVRMGERRAIDQVEVRDPAAPWEAVGEWAQQAAADLRMELERVGNGPG